MPIGREHQRLIEYRDQKVPWKNWGPYLSERAWGTVREDYSADGSAWTYFPHDHARSRAYRWNEDGLAGICDRNQYLCFALALWNRRDPFLKERMFGLTSPQGNHGEDVKEYYFYLDSTPTHSYMKMLYKYPQAPFPYEDLIAENRRRGYDDPEYELLDTGVLNDNRYFDVFVEYAKASGDDLLIRIEVVNRAAESAAIDVLPTLWFRNTWSWGYTHGPMRDVHGKPQLRRPGPDASPGAAVHAVHPSMPDYWLYADGAPELVFTENETNNHLLFGGENASPYTKDAFHRYLVSGEEDAVNLTCTGTKAAAIYRLTLGAGERHTLRLRLSNKANAAPFDDFDTLFAQRQAEADEFYAEIQPAELADDVRAVQRQAFAGMLWSKQLYYYDVEQWLTGDPAFPTPPESRKGVKGRNVQWEHLNNFDVLSMPDKWEYPWFASWDLGCHCLALVLVDPDFAKRQLELLTREWYMHPNGQLPAYEWSFSDANPPVHAWAAWRVYKIDASLTGKPDRPFLEGIFQKLLLNFTWWVNQKDSEGRNVFQGGFLGLDNISIFNRSDALPFGGELDQSDGTAWMGFFSLIMLKIALELALENPVYQDMATKFFEHFLAIARAVSGSDGSTTSSLWDDEDGFFYDRIRMPDGTSQALKVRSLVGMMSLLAVETLEPDLLKTLPDFSRRMTWFVRNRPHLSGNMASIEVPGLGERRLISILTRDRLASVLRYMLDETEFLSDYGIRSVSKYHEAHPYTFSADGASFTLSYQPAESHSGLFGGNSNWRGPIWFPINFLVIESLQKFNHYYGETFKIELPTGSGNWLNLKEVAAELSQRLIRLFLRDGERRPIYGGTEIFQSDPLWRDLILFSEYFHGDNGAGLGASHQTGWTGLVAKLIQQSGGTM